jgi:hypothetical protein
MTDIVQSEFTQSINLDPVDPVTNKSYELKTNTTPWRRPIPNQRGGHGPSLGSYTYMSDKEQAGKSVLLDRKIKTWQDHTEEVRKFRKERDRVLALNQANLLRYHEYRALPIWTRLLRKLNHQDVKKPVLVEFTLTEPTPITPPPPYFVTDDEYESEFSTDAPTTPKLTYTADSGEVISGIPSNPIGEK